ncbi:6-phosphogluconate phosphatase [Burkholderia glumae]|uniref:HAD family hydrolase n=1 Tax=Burkholderia glumae TaxID=337 RepID=UPI00157A3F5B|nr:HAD family phosphatase [Burkholderia glumae]QKM46619.1 6-phosphogluconate phosphatase [Burkholderia glumae]
MPSPLPTPPREGRALISDCDGVLVDSEAIAERIVIDRLEALWQIEGVHDAIRPLLGMRTAVVLTEAAAALGRVISEEQIHSIREEIRARAGEAPQIPGAVEALQALPLLLACASNSDLDYVERVVARLGLDACFGGRLFTGDRVAQPKPAPDVYLAASRELRVPPAGCAVIEDSVTGARAALAAGMTVLGFTGSAHPPGERRAALREIGVHVTFERMSELPGLVERWLGDEFGVASEAGERAGSAA